MVILGEECATELGKVADEHAWVKVADEESLPSVLKQGFLKILKANALIDVLQLFFLGSP